MPVRRWRSGWPAARLRWGGLIVLAACGSVPAALVVVMSLTAFCVALVAILTLMAGLLLVLGGRRLRQHLGLGSGRDSLSR